MMFLKVKEFALHLYVESRNPERSRRVKGGTFSRFFRSRSRRHFLKTLVVGFEARVTSLKIAEPELEGL